MITADSLAVGRTWAQLSRPQNVLYPGFLAAGTAFFVTSDLLISVLCYLCIFSMYALATAFNNLHDVRTDTLNKREDNPLVHGKLRMVHVVVFCLLHTVILSALQFLLEQPGSLLVCLVYVLLAAGYSHARINLQARGWTAPLVLTVHYGCLPLALGFLQAGKPWSVPVILYILLQLALLFPLLLAKDYKDLYGDRLTGKNTPLVRYGKRRVVSIARTVAVLAAILYVFLGIRLGGHVIILLISAILCGWFAFALHANEGVVKSALRKLATIALVGISLYPFSLIY